MSLNEEEQKNRAFLRSRYLYVMSKLAGGNNCKIRMYENTDVSCKVKAFDSGFENVLVEDLQTPYAMPINKAILRTNDIITMHFEVKDVFSL